jgi:hypothetical protein
MWRIIISAEAKNRLNITSISQLMQQTQQSNQMYQQMLQQEQQNAQQLEQLAQRERQAVQTIQQALQGHQIAMQKMQQCMQMWAQLEQTVSRALAFNVTQTMQQAQQPYASYRH